MFAVTGSVAIRVPTIACMMATPGKSTCRIRFPAQQMGEPLPRLLRVEEKAACLSAHDERTSPADQGRKLQFLTISRVSAWLENGG
jgi:hypothetical protein